MKPGDYPPGTTWPLVLDQTPTLLFCSTADNRTVVLTEGVWTSHILHSHSEMESKLHYVDWCLTHPDFINYDVQNPARECYYVAYTSPRGRTLWIKVVVHFDASVQESRGADGFVVTALVCGRIKSKEVKKWP